MEREVLDAPGGRDFMSLGVAMVTLGIQVPSQKVIGPPTPT